MGGRAESGSADGATTPDTRATLIRRSSNTITAKRRVDRASSSHAALLFEIRLAVVNPPPSLALGLCTHNRGPRILRTLEAIAALDRAGGRVTRLIVIDNHSTDDTAAVVDRFIAAAPAIPTTRIFEPVQGLAAARDRFIRESDEPLIAFIDDDCLPDRDWAAATLAHFDAHPRAGMVGGRVMLEWESGPTPLARRCATMLAQQDLGDQPLLLDHPERGLVGVALAMRRAAIADSGWLTQRELTDRSGRELTSGGDFELAIRVRAAGWQTWYTPLARARHLIPPERQTLEYLTRLSRGVSLSKARLKWIAAGRPGIEWVRAQSRRALRRRLKSRLLEWRPARRALKLAEHDARCEGWLALERELQVRAPT